MVVGVLCVCGVSRTVGQTGEVRAMWVQRGSLASPKTIQSAVEMAKDGRFNTLIVQVRGRGDAFYDSRYDPRPPLLARQPSSFDPLELMLATAHRAGLKVHAWVNVNLVSDATPPAAPRHVVYTHPEWLMVPRPLAADLARMNPRNAAYLRRLSEYAKARSDRVEGLFLSPVHKGAVDYTVRVIGDIVTRYAVDGIHLDYIRFPNDEFDYSAEVLERVPVGGDLDCIERRASRVRVTCTRPPALLHRDVSAAMAGVPANAAYDAVDANPVCRESTPFAGDVVGCGVSRCKRGGEPAVSGLGQVARGGLLDAICPMAYTTDPVLFRSQIANVEHLAGGHPVWAGIGAYQLSPGATVENIRTARQLGAEGVVLFSYDNLNAPYVTMVAKEVFAR